MQACHLGRWIHLPSSSGALEGEVALGALCQLLLRDLAAGLSVTGLIVSPAFGGTTAWKLMYWWSAAASIVVVRRQGFLDRDFTELKEGLAHRVGLRLLWRSGVCGDRRWSFV